MGLCLNINLSRKVLKYDFVIERMHCDRENALSLLWIHAITKLWLGSTILIKKIKNIKKLKRTVLTKISEFHQ